MGKHAVQPVARLEERFWRLEDSRMDDRPADSPGRVRQGGDLAAVEANVRRTLRPLLRELRQRCQGEHEALFEALDRALADIAAPLARDLGSALGGRLSERELTVCRLLRDGLDGAKIAAALSLSPRTVEFHRNRIRRKLGLRRGGPDLAGFLQNL